MSDEHRLCFVDETWAYFANVPPTEVWGDDWDDAPHDCNAGEPYVKDGQRLVKVAFEGPYEVVGGSFGPKQWDDLWGRWLSVEQINRGDAPWLADPGYGETFPKPKATIPAGITLTDFRRRMREAGGQVYEATISAVEASA